MRILHVENTAGNPYRLAMAQRELGHEAHVIETWRSYIGYPHHIENYYDGNKLQNLLKMTKTVKWGRHFDIVHAHSGLRRIRIDVAALKAFFRKPLVVHYRGEETRRGYGVAYQRLIDRKFVSTPDLLKWHSDAVFLPNPMTLLPYSFDPSDTPYVLHMPTDRRLKGTSLILEAVQELKDEGVRFDFHLVEGVAHEEAIIELKKTHIVIDQIIDERETGIPGLPGTISLEAMSMGKTSVSHLSSDMADYYPGIPIVNADVNRESIKEKLRYLIENMDETKRIGLAGREYVGRFHDPVAIAKRTIKEYEELL